MIKISEERIREIQREMRGKVESGGIFFYYTEYAPDRWGKLIRAKSTGFDTESLTEFFDEFHG